MAQKVLVQMLDDIDGSAATQTVPFSLDVRQDGVDLVALQRGLVPVVANANGEPATARGLLGRSSRGTSCA